jgi:iron complex transport system substrate-binding protein
MRIVSLLPAATEIVCQLGLADELVGVSHECDWPESVRGLPKVTRSLIPAGMCSREIDQEVRERLQTARPLYSLDTAVVENLRADLIVTQTLCDVCAVAEDEVRDAVRSLSGRPRVLNLSPTSIEDLFDDLRRVGAAAGRKERAEREIAALQARVANVAARSARIPDELRPRVVVLEWIDPPFSSGHWTPELVQLAGGREMIGVAGARSRRLEWREVAATAPQVLIIACCGFNAQRTLNELPVLRSYPGWARLPCVQSGRVYVVDGSAYFNRPGPRLIESLEILSHLLHSTEHELPAGAALQLQLPAGESQARPFRTRAECS